MLMASGYPLTLLTIINNYLATYLCGWMISSIANESIQGLRC